MTARASPGKALPPVYPLGLILTDRRKWTSGQRRNQSNMTGLALVMFVVLIAFGQKFFGWSDPDGKIQLVLFTTFVLGVICGYKSKG